MSQQRSGGNNFALDYIDVAERLVEFREKHPQGSLQPVDPAHPYKVETIGDQTFIVYVAAAYRTPDDPRPGIGTAYEAFPGRTPYTRFSELQNAETSAWGRAIVAALAADTKRGVASAEEVRNRQAERETGGQPIGQGQAPRQANGRRLQAAGSGSPSEAMAFAVRASECGDADKMVAEYQAAKAKGLLGQDVRKALHADLLDALGIEPSGAVTLEAWLTKAGTFVRANGGMTVAEKAKLDAEAVPA